LTLWKRNRLVWVMDVMRITGKSLHYHIDHLRRRMCHRGSSVASGSRRPVRIQG
jgi:hypothetical protein